MRLPVRCLHDLGKRGAAIACEQLGDGGGPQSYQSATAQ